MTALGGPLAARISRLEQIVSGLQGQAGGGEQLSPNYLTLSPTGQVGASFTGLVNALGLIIPAAASISLPLPEANSVVWDRQSDGAAIATIGAGEAAGTDSLGIEAQAAQTGFTAQSVVSAINHGSTVSAAVVAQATDTLASVFAQLSDGSEVSILSLGQKSSFPQIPAGGPAQLFIDGPFVSAIPAIGAGNQAFGSTFNTVRTAWTLAAVLGTPTYLSGGTVWLSGSQYLGGSSFKPAFSTSPTGASVATSAAMFVLGF